MLGVEPEAGTRQAHWQVSVKDVNVFAQQSMSNHLQFGSLQGILPIWKKMSNL